MPNSSCELYIKQAGILILPPQYDLGSKSDRGQVSSMSAPKYLRPLLAAQKVMAGHSITAVMMKLMNSFLMTMQVGSAALVYVQPSQDFAMPEEASRPMIMIGPGTGIAPFR